MKTQMIKELCISLILSLPFSVGAQISYGEIRGIIKTTEAEAVPFATVKILQGNQLIGGTQSDENGKYKYKPLTPGRYDMVVMTIGYLSQQINNVTVDPGEATYVDVKLSVNTLNTVTVTAKAIDYTKAGVDANMFVFESVSGEELNQNAAYVSGNIGSAVVAITSDVIETGDGELHFRGSRTGASSNYVDGVKTYGETFIPGIAIENLTVFTGGVPACYGDLTSGMVMITTKSYFSGIREKNIRNAAFREKREEDKRIKQEKEDNEKRKKEIEDEKKKDRKTKK